MAGSDNYNPASETVQLTVEKADQTIAWDTPANIVYGTTLSATQLNATVTVPGSEAHGAVTYDPDFGTELNAGTHTLTVNVAGSDNYNPASETVYINVLKRPITVTPLADQFKYCGQSDHELEYEITSGSLVGEDDFDGSLSRDPGEISGESYEINIGTLTLGSNYDLICTPSVTLLIKPVTIDASASSIPVEVGNPATLTATVVNESLVTVENVSVTFVVTYFDSNSGNEVEEYRTTILTDEYGIAEESGVDLPDVKVYKVTAIAGEGCSESTAYLPVYDPSAGFVTGGGWIWSPAEAYTADVNLEGKANFGFVAKYKKGKSDVDGNTEFHFHAAGMKFKSQFHESGSLVISGGKATYRGEGTINGEGSYKFTLVAFDGDWNDGTDPDRFRIKIYGDNGVVYDNAIENADENSDDATELGGGSIVIHEVKSNNKTKSGYIEPKVELEPVESALKVYPNPFKDRARFEFVSPIATQAKIDIYNMAGQMVQTVFDGFVEENTTYNAEFKPEAEVSGMYFYRMQLGEQIYNGKLMYKRE
ncbi:T9SS type A sorting domain-containing protein [uncultured Draconibacterium sp.]|uniref:T9SS type A sorting domain-containing protein n=1 Tax=uncultured Draconibacterium sp. TaxID=1573823 RepID=UPI0029C66EF9|nr:T9SS type A sorting domain-containing protein [uncultured Draconibacterium sp.]